MKKFAYASVLALALVALLSTVALAGDGHDHGKKAEKATKSAMNAEMGKCCIASAEAGKGCCGKDADTLKASYADYKAVAAVKADMHACCATKMAAGEGCCGKDAAALKADYSAKVHTAKAQHAVQAGMGECCTEKLAAGEGCCGKDAKELKAGYDKKVAQEEKKMASK